jgi:hypothetical protein
MRHLPAWGLFVAAMILASAVRAAPYELVDLATPYAGFWDETREMPSAERVAAFKTRFNTLLPGFFNAQRVGWMTDEQYDAAIAASFEKFPALRERFTATTNSFAKLLAPAHATFTKTFADLRPIGPIYIVHSLGEFDGGTRPVGGVNRLMFGADVIAQLHDFSDERPFFHHELFHVYHAQFFTECEQMWCALWMEGLATLAAKRLNAQATDAELLLTSPRPIRPEVERNRAAAFCAIASRLDSTDAADYAALFSSGPTLAGLPPRVGYYVGYLLAEEAARGRSVMKLAHLRNVDAHDTLHSAMTRLAHCPADSLLHIRDRVSGG